VLRKVNSGWSERRKVPCLRPLVHFRPRGYPLCFWTENPCVDSSILSLPTNTRIFLISAALEVRLGPRRALNLNSVPEVRYPGAKTAAPRAATISAAVHQRSDLCGSDEVCNPGDGLSRERSLDWALVIVRGRLLRGCAYPGPLGIERLTWCIAARCAERHGFVGALCECCVRSQI
jgi:hypothetical protein